MRILAIETSCDETAIAIMDIAGTPKNPKIKILSNALLSQVKLHEQYGGVYPTLAKREHQKNLPILLKKVLEEANLDKDNPVIDFIAVTSGPGLEPALWTGITFAQELGDKWSKPVVPINHMEGHIYSVLFDKKSKLALPALALLVSGGHTELVLMNDFGRYEVLGETRDDAVGEAFDKVARMLKLPYPGGPEISRLAEFHRETSSESGIILPRPMINSGNFDFSYSGLKTAVLYKIKELGELTNKNRAELARAFEDAAVEVLVEKTRRALEMNPEVKTLIIGGGVSANIHLSRELEKLAQEFRGLELLIPARKLTTDNALMIGLAGFIKVYKSPDILKEKAGIKADGNLSL